MVTVAICSRSLSRSTAARMSGPCARSNGRAASSRMRFSGLGARARPREGGSDRRTVSGTSSLVGDDLARNPAIGDQRGPQHFVSADDLVQGSLEGSKVKPAHEPDGCGDVIRCADPAPVDRGTRAVAARTKPAAGPSRSDQFERRGLRQRSILESLLDECVPVAIRSARQ